VDDERPTAEDLARYAQEFNESLTLRAFGFEVSFPDLETVRVTLRARAEHRGGLGSEAINGGVLAATFDLVLGCTPALIDPKRRAATVQLSMQFERAVRGEGLIAEAKVRRATRTLVFADAELRDLTGVVCARASGIVARSEQPWASGRSPAIN
jgi:uncharacterized protein (TIGR00369 family)